MECGAMRVGSTRTRCRSAWSQSERQAAVYLIFNEGYLASGADALTRQELSSEAIRLGRILADLMPEVLLRLHPTPVARLNNRWRWQWRMVRTPVCDGSSSGPHRKRRTRFSAASSGPPVAVAPSAKEDSGKCVLLKKSTGGPSVESKRAWMS
jgi:hypothetical protein